MAVPMSIHRYTCLLSALTISPSYVRARPRPRALLPAAVGPTIARSGVRMVYCGGQRYGPAVGRPLRNSLDAATARERGGLTLTCNLRPPVSGYPVRGHDDEWRGNDGYSKACGQRVTRAAV